MQEKDKRTALNEELLRVATSGKASLVIALIRLGADIDSAAKNGDTALHLAAEGGFADIVKLLISKGADVNKTNALLNTPLHTATKGADIETVKILIAAGADVNVKSFLENTPYDLAASLNHSEIAYIIKQATEQNQFADVKGGFADEVERNRSAASLGEREGR